MHSSAEACCTDFGLTLQHNKSETTESIKEAKAICTHSIKEVEANCTLTIKEAEANCVHTIREAETPSSTAIRDAESQGASQAHSIQQLHTKDVQHLEEEAIEEESKGQLNFLSACQATLRAGPPKSHGMLAASYHILLGHVHWHAIFLTFPKEHPPLNKGLSQGFLPLLAPTAPGPSPRPKQ